MGFGKTSGFHGSQGVWTLCACQKGDGDAIVPVLLLVRCIRSERARDPSSGNLGQYPQACAHKRGGTTAVGRVRFRWLLGGGSSQWRLFPSALVYECNYKKWIGGVVPPLECVRSLGHCRSLALFGIRVEDTNGGGFRAFFSAFREALTHLSHYSFTMAPDTSLTLVDYFFNVK